MATLAQLRSEPWWDREVVTGELDWLADELCRRTGQPRVAAGTKGNEAHLSGVHRSQEWILNSRYCTSRSYTVQGGLNVTQLRHVAGLDFTPGVWGTATNRRLMVAITSRVLAELKTGRLEGVRELFGTTDGRTVTGWNNAANRVSTSDSSHLDHIHLSFDRRRLTDRALMERILAVALGEDDDMTSLDDTYKGPDGIARSYAIMIRDLHDHTFWGRWGLEYPKSIQAHLAELAARPPAVWTDAQVQALAERIAAVLVASNTNGLTPADHAGVVADVKQALTQGTG